MRLDYLCVSWIAPGRYSGGSRSCILREQVGLGQMDMNSPATPPQSPIDRLKVLINSSTPIVVMETVEEVCAMSLVRTACSQLSLPVFEWTIADGLVRCGTDVAGQALSATGSGAGVAPKTAVYNTTDPVQALAKLQLDSNGVDAMAANLRGLTEEAAERAISQTVVGRLALSPECITDVLDAKKALLKRSEMLEFVDSTDTMSSVGGLEFGLEPPKGVIILGVQGCGKSLCARAVAGEWKLPLVKFDTAAVYDKFIGETEKRIRKVFQAAEGLAPCVLWIDELEKVFAGSGPDSASADAGVSSRLLASFLSWMQDRKAAVFVAATCNNVTVLPPELIRKGRFDELFFVDLPSVDERKQVFSIQLTKRKRNPADYDLDRVAAAAGGFSGAEIESAVQTGLYAAFSRKQELSNEDLLTALSSTVPLSVTRAEEIAKLRAWAKERAVWASSPEAKRENK